MKIGVVKEVKDNENRVSVVPAGVKELIAHGHEVYVQKNAGAGSGFDNKQYQKAGATILDTMDAIYQEADLIVKVNGEKKFFARPGTMKDNICVKITEVYDEMHELLRNYF